MAADSGEVEGDAMVVDTEPDFASRLAERAGANMVKALQHDQRIRPVWVCVSGYKGDGERSEDGGSALCHAILPSALTKSQQDRWRRGEERWHSEELSVGKNKEAYTPDLRAPFPG